MSKLLQTWRSWSTRRRAVSAIVALVAVAGAGVLAYELVKRPADVANPDVEFAEQRQPDRERQRERPRDTTVNWPTYGYDNQRTRYFQTNIVKPPYHGSDWSFQAGKLLEFSPIVVDDRLYFMDIDARFYALNAKRGKVAWSKRIGKLNASAPAFANDRLFAVSLDPGQAVALRPGDGKVLWRQPLPGRSESSPLTVKNELVIFGCECGTVFALDQRNGSIKWSVDTGGAIKGALALAKGNVYGGNYAGEFFALDAKTGNEEWRINTIGGGFGRGGGIYSTPAIAFGRVYFGSLDSRVYSAHLDTGEIAWSKSTGAEVYSSPAIADTNNTPPTIYIGSADDNFYALDAETGAVRWQKDTGGDVTGAPTVLGNVVYVAVIDDGTGTIGYDIRNGKKVYEHEEGKYNPVITDGERMYLTGYSTVRAFTHKGRPKPDLKRPASGKQKERGSAGKKGRAKGQSAGKRQGSTGDRRPRARAKAQRRRG